MYVCVFLCYFLSVSLHVYVSRCMYVSSCVCLYVDVSRCICVSFFHVSAFLFLVLSVNVHVFNAAFTPRFSVFEKT